MNDLRKFSYHIGETDTGEFVAASSASPFFCFVGASEDEVNAAVERAIRFWNSQAGVARPRRTSKAVSLVQFIPQKRVEVDLEAA